MPKEYLGDGAYVDFDGFSFVLTTENGIETTNEIVLEPSAMNFLKDYAERMTLTDTARETGTSA